MNKQRKTSNILNVFQYDEATGIIGLNGVPVSGYGLYLHTNINDGSIGIDSSSSINALYLLKSGTKQFEISYDTSGVDKIFRLLPYQSGSFFQIGNPSNAGANYVFISEPTYGNVLIGPGIGNGTGNLTGATAATHKIQFNGAVFANSSIQATSFKITGGASTGFLKADGTVDSVTYLSSFTETDPIFLASVAHGITSTQVSHWDTAYGWGNHALAGYLVSSNLTGYATETYVGTQIANLVASAPSTLDTLNELAAALGNDPSFATTVSTSIGTKVPQARTLTINGTTYDLTANRSWTVPSSIASATDSAVSGPTSGQLLRYNGTAWANWSPNYLTSFTETDPIYTASSWYTTTNNATNWNTAYGWGNHASAGYLTTASAASTYASLSGSYSNPTWITGLAWSKITGAPVFLTSYTETDPYRVTAVAVSGTSTKTITLTRADASTVTTTWTDYDTDTNTYASTLGFSGGTLTLTNNNASTVTVSLDGRYLQSYTETDTLATVTGRGSSTNSAITINNTLTLNTSSTQPVLIYGDSAATNGLFRIQIDEVNDSFGSGARTFLGDGGIDIFIGTGNSSYTPANSYIALNHSGEISMGAGSATKHFVLATNGTLTLNNGLSNGSGRGLIVAGSGDMSLSDGGSIFWGAYDYGTSTYIRAWDDSNLMRFYINGTNSVTFTSSGISASAISVGGNAVWHAGNLTNLNQLSNGPGYITSYSETDTLNSVTSRGNTTSNSVRFGSYVDVSPTGSAFRFYDGTTFRGGFGLDSWGHSGSDANLVLYVNGDNTLFFSTSGTKRASLSSSAFNSLVALQQSGNQVLHAGNYSSYNSYANLVLTNDGSSRVMYIRGSGNIIQFQDAAANNKWELVGRDGTFYIYKGYGTGSGYIMQVNDSGNTTFYNTVTFNNTISGSVSGTAASISGYNNPTTAATANTIVYRDSNGHITGNYILGSYFNSSAGNSENPTIGQIWTQSTGDNYLRKSTPAHFISQLGLITSSNIGSQSVSYASSAGNSTTVANVGITTLRGLIGYNSVGFYVNGDANTYYPVLIGLGGQFGMNRYSISRSYSDPAPWDPIGTGSHRGGLTLTFDCSSDIAWGGNDKSWRIIQFAESYTTMVAGMALPVTGGIIVWLRGGGAYYNLQGPNGINHGADVYYGGYTAANGAVYGTRSNTSSVSGEILSKFPIRGYGDGDIYINNSRVLYAAGDPYAYNMNQNVRTTDSPTFRTLSSSEGYSVVALGYNNNGGFAMNNSGTYWGMMWNYAINDWRLGWGNQVNQTGWNLRWDNGSNVWVNNNLNAGGYIQAYGDLYLGAGSSGQVRMSTYNNRNLQVIGGGGSDIGILGTVAGASTFGFQLYGNSSGEYGFLTYAWGAWAIRMTTGGAINANGDITAYSSDKRLKDNITNIPNSLQKVLSLNGVTFDWNDTAINAGFVPSQRYNDSGLIAQEVQTVLPQAIKQAPFDRDKDGSSKSGQNYLTVQYEKLVPLLVEAIKEQQVQIEDLKKQIEYLVENK